MGKLAEEEGFEPSVPVASQSSVSPLILRLRQSSFFSPFPYAWPACRAKVLVPAVMRGYYQKECRPLFVGGGSGGGRGGGFKARLSVGVGQVELDAPEFHFFDEFLVIGGCGLQWD